MKLPNAEQASVSEAKIRYLLSEEKSGGKDRFFKRFGFSVVQWELLKDALLQHAQSHEVHQIIHTEIHHSRRADYSGWSSTSCTIGVAD